MYGQILPRLKNYNSLLPPPSFLSSTFRSHAIYFPFGHFPPAGIHRQCHSLPLPGHVRPLSRTLRSCPVLEHFFACSPSFIAHLNSTCFTRPGHGPVADAPIRFMFIPVAAYIPLPPNTRPLYNALRGRPRPYLPVSFRVRPCCAFYSSSHLQPHCNSLLPPSECALPVQRPLRTPPTMRFPLPARARSHFARPGPIRLLPLAGHLSYPRELSTRLLVRGPVDRQPTLPHALPVRRTDHFLLFRSILTRDQRSDRPPLSHLTPCPPIYHICGWSDPLFSHKPFRSILLVSPPPLLIVRFVVLPEFVPDAHPL